MTPLSWSECEKFLTETRVAAVSVERGGGHAPHLVPIWFDYQPDGVITLIMDLDSLKDRLIKKAGRLSLLVQNDKPPYRYVRLEGPVISREPATYGQFKAMAARYLTGNLLDTFLSAVRPETIMFKIKIARWQGVDFNAH